MGTIKIIALIAILITIVSINALIWNKIIGDYKKRKQNIHVFDSIMGKK